MREEPRQRKDKREKLGPYEAPSQGGPCRCPARRSPHGHKPYTVKKITSTGLAVKCYACGASWLVANGSKLFAEISECTIDNGEPKGITPGVTAFIRSRETARETEQKEISYSSVEKVGRADVMFRRSERIAEWNKLRGKRLKPTSVSYQEFFKEFIELGVM